MLGGVDGVSVFRVHDTRVVEHDIRAAPAVLILDQGFYFRLLGDVALEGLDPASIGSLLLDLGKGPFKCGLRDVGHQDIGAFTGEQDAGLETNSSGVCQRDNIEAFRCGMREQEYKSSGK